jgi:hypothetical protein
MLCLLVIILGLKTLTTLTTLTTMIVLAIMVRHLVRLEYTVAADLEQVKEELARAADSVQHFGRRAQAAGTPMETVGGFRRASDQGRLSWIRLGLPVGLALGETWAQRSRRTSASRG